MCPTGDSPAHVTCLYLDGREAGPDPSPCPKAALRTQAMLKRKTTNDCKTIRRSEWDRVGTPAETGTRPVLSVWGSGRVPDTW